MSESLVCGGVWEGGERNPLAGSQKRRLGFSWEAHATALANCADAELSAKLKEIAAAEGIDLSSQSVVVIGQDTRPSSPALSQAALEGALAGGAAVEDLGVVTTPQLHYVVRCRNDSAYGKPSIQGYGEKLASAFEELFRSSGRTEPLRLKV